MILPTERAGVVAGVEAKWLRDKTIRDNRPDVPKSGVEI